MNKLKPLPIGVQTFRDVIEGNFVYIDKTQYIFHLLQQSKGVYFLSRPRRFGKSLFISTLHEIFAGHKELFQGLWIYKSDYNWQTYPVVRLDMSQMKADNAQELKELLSLNLKDLADKNNILLETKLYFSQFKELLQKLSKKSETGKVVVLIDEYDTPIIHHITDVPKAEQMREILKNFYGIIKSMDEVIRFVFLTGVSKFSKAGIFSELNNLNDLTMVSEYSSMLGLTEEEIASNLNDYLEAFAEYKKIPKQEIVEQLRFWYNGYCFSENCQTVYNPFSTLMALEHKRFTNYWFETGTPTFLLNHIKKKLFNISAIPTKVKEINFSTYELERLDMLPLLFQTGYLTIKGYDEESRNFTLDYPNFEVKDAFLSYLLRYMTDLNGQQDVYLEKLYEALRDENLEDFFLVLNTIFVHLPYDIQIKQESYYQSIFYLVFMLLGVRIDVEVKTDIGRIDAVVETNSIYIFEFKLKGSKEQALAQIKEKGYYKRYEGKGKPIYLIGVQFQPKAEEEYFEWIEEKMENGVRS